MQGSTSYYVVYGFLILGFSYFWVSIMFKPIQIADDLKKYGGYIPGVRPGNSTAAFLDFIMTRLTLAGAVFLTVIALFPDLLYFSFKVPYRIALFFGGTGTLITVGVLLETMKQIETFLIQRNYEGFLNRGHLKGRTNVSAQIRQFTLHEAKNLRWLWLTVSILFTLGLVSWLIQLFCFKS
jgi:preprotein translocase subunit SecY